MDSKTADEMAAGGPGIVTLGGTDYLCAPVTDAKLVAVRQWTKKRRAKSPQQMMLEALAALPADKAKAIAALPPALRDSALKAIFPEMPPDALTEEEAQEAIVSVEGCRFVAWLHLQPPMNPGLKREALDALITEDNFLDVYLQLNEATGLNKLAAGRDSGNPSGRPG